MTSFAQITSNVAVQQELQKAYGTVNNIDPFEGGMAEDHVAGSDLGPLFTKIIADQFNRLRAGDRFFYLNESWNADELRLLTAGQHAGQGHRGEHGDHQPCRPTSSSSRRRSAGAWSRAKRRGVLTQSPRRGLSGVTVQLEDSERKRLATTVTDRSGLLPLQPAHGVERDGGLQREGGRAARSRRALRNPRS